MVLFGPTEGGKSHTLKGKTGSERGVLPRAVEDIFQIVRNSEDVPDMGIDIVPKKEYGARHEVDRLFLKVQAYQIFCDKIFDLLGNSSNRKPGALDHYIDK